MEQFVLRPVVNYCDTFTEFVNSIGFRPNDCIFTVRFLRDKLLKPLNISSRVVCFEDYGSGEPTDVIIDRILADVATFTCSRIIAIGGGSVLDIAKIIALKQTGSALNFFEKTVDIVKEKVLVLVPTTCGTGSEVTNIAISSILSKNTKMGLALEALYADRAVLIPELIYELPEFVLVSSSIDALVHALESYVSPKSGVYSEAFSVPAIRMLINAHKYFLANGRLACVRSIAKDLMIASNYAGIAFGNTGVGAVHALAYPLGGVHHVPHGEANARILNAVFDLYRAKNPDGKIENLGRILADAMQIANGSDPWRELQILVDSLLPKKSLRDYGMTEDEIENFADSVVEKQQRLLINNYVELSRNEIRDIFERLW